MANTIKQKRGTTDPAASDLVVGELAINTTSGNLFTKKDDGTVAEAGSSLADDKKMQFGDNNDLEIFHNSANGNSVIKETGGGSLILSGDNVVIRNQNGNENKAQFNTDAAVVLFYNNLERFRTTYDGINISGRVVAEGVDLGDNAITDNSGELEILANNFRIFNSAANETKANFPATGQAELYHSNSKKLETTSTGATVTGTCVATEFSGSGASLTGVAKSDTTGITGASAVDNIVMISQADYDAISSPDANTIYYITS